MSETAPIIDKMNRISAFIHEAQIDLGDGKVANLTDLDSEVMQICDEILTLPPEEAKKIQPIMADIIGKLETLGAALQAFQSELKERTK